MIIDRTQRYTPSFFPHDTLAIDEKAQSIRQYTILRGIWLTCIGQATIAWDSPRMQGKRRHLLILNKKSLRDFHIRYSEAKRQEAKGKDFRVMLEKTYKEMRNPKSRSLEGLTRYLKDTCTTTSLQGLETPPASMQDRYRAHFHKIQTKEGGTVAYLFGTIHYGKKSFHPMPYKVLRAFFRSDELYFEIYNVPAKEYLAHLKKIFSGFKKKMHAPDKNVRKAARLHYITWLLYLALPFLFGFIARMVFGIQRKYGIEVVLERLSKRYHLQFIQSLETLEERSRVFENIVENLGKDSEKREKKKSLKDMREKVFGGFLGDELDRERSSDDAFLIDRRNKNMANRAGNLFLSVKRQKPRFLAVGCAHVPGMVELLKEKGFTVIRK